MKVGKPAKICNVNFNIASSLGLLYLGEKLVEGPVTGKTCHMTAAKDLLFVSYPTYKILQ